jgi:hypothetical protein
MKCPWFHHTITVQPTQMVYLHVVSRTGNRHFVFQFRNIINMLELPREILLRHPPIELEESIFQPNLSYP